MRFFSGASVLIVDEVGYLPMQAEAAAALFQVEPPLPQRLDHPDHQPVDQQLGPDLRRPMVAAAMLDRLPHRSTVLHIDGESYGMRAHQRRTHNLRDAAKPTERD
jgi:DNA replication protein DnaC